MPKIYHKKEVIYYVDNDKHNKSAINELVYDLYLTYSSVTAYPNGTHERRIICNN